MLHVENDDNYNTVLDKTVQMHKLSKRKFEWYQDPYINPDNPHEQRFVAQPMIGLPVVHSKNKKILNLIYIEWNKWRIRINRIFLKIKKYKVKKER